jgi:hypothetical protein
MPQRPVVSSSTLDSLWLMSSRLVSAFSRSSEPMTLRRVVTVSCSMACRKLAISYVAFTGSTTRKYRTVSIETTRLSEVITGCGGKLTTCSRMSTLDRTASISGTRRLNPGVSVFWYRPSRSTTNMRCCGTTRTDRIMATSTNSPMPTATTSAMISAIVSPSRPSRSRP